jgi:hypothetical protein
MNASRASTKKRELLVFFSIDSHEESRENRRQEPGEDDQPQADAINADVVIDAEGRDPRRQFDELELGGGTVEARPRAAASSANVTTHTASPMRWA